MKRVSMSLPDTEGKQTSGGRKRKFQALKLGARLANRRNSRGGRMHEQGEQAGKDT